MPGLAAADVSSTYAPDIGDDGRPNWSSRGVKRRVLLADPCADNLMSTAIMLRLWGHDVRGVTSGLGALEMARTYRPDTVLMEVALPRLDGFEVARRLRRREDGDDLLLIAVTGYGDEATKRKVRDAGFDWHFVKPADPGELHSLLATLQRGLRKEEAGRHSLVGSG